MGKTPRQALRDPDLPFNLSVARGAWARLDERIEKVLKDSKSAEAATANLLLILNED